MADDASCDATDPEVEAAAEERLLLCLRNLPRHYAQGKSWDDLVGILTDYEFIAAKVGLSGVRGARGADAPTVRDLLDDFSLAEQVLPAHHESRVALSELASALGFSVGALQRDLRQLPTQLHARLAQSRDRRVERVLAEARLRTSFAWLRAINTALERPGEPQLRVLIGDGGSVHRVIVLADGSRAVCVSSDNAVRVWDLRSGNCIRVLTGHADRVQSIALGPGGLVASVSRDGTVRLWDVETGRSLQVIDVSGLELSYRRIAVMPDGRQLVCSRDGGPIDVLDIRTGDLVATLEGHESEVGILVVSADGRRIVSADYSHEIRVWELASRTCVRVVGSGGSGIRAVDVSSDGVTAAALGSDAVLRVWDLETGRQRHAVEALPPVLPIVALDRYARQAIVCDLGWLHFYDLASGTWRHASDTLSSTATQVVPSPDGRHVVVVLHDNTLHVWDGEDGRPLRVLKGHANQIHDAAFSADGRSLVTASDDSTLRVWDVTVDDAAPGPGDQGRLVHCSLSADGSHAAFVLECGERELAVWDTNVGRAVCSLKGHTSRIEGSVFAAEGAVISLDQDGILRVWSVASGAMRGEPVLRLRPIRGMALTSDGKQCVWATDNECGVLDIHSGTCPKVLSHSGRMISAVGVTPDGKRAVLGSMTGDLLVCDLMTSQIRLFRADVRPLRWAVGEVRCLRVFAQSARVTAVYADSTLRVWDVDSGACLATLELLHENFVDAAITPDGGRIISVTSAPVRLDIWEAASGKHLRRLVAGDQVIRNVALSPDGRRAALGFYDGVLVVWDLEKDALCASLAADVKLLWKQARIAADRVVVWDEYNRVNILRIEEPAAERHGQ